MKTEKTRLNSNELIEEIKKHLHDECEYTFSIGISEFIINIYQKE